MPLTDEQVRTLLETTVGASGNRIAQAMELLEVTQSAVADATGLNQQYVSDVYRGANGTIGVDNAHKFAQYFGCTIEILFPAKPAPKRVAVSS